MSNKDCNYRIKFSRRRNSIGASYKYFQFTSDAINYAYQYDGDKNMFLEEKTVIGDWKFMQRIEFGKALV